MIPLNKFLSRYKPALIRSLVIIVILILSVVIGFIYQSLTDRADRRRYPTPEQLQPIVTRYSGEYGVPEYVIYGVIKTESNFDSGAESAAGARGLMQIMPATFDWLVSITQDGYEAGMMFDPETNLRYGTYYLSYLYLKYADWKTVFAAYNAGPDAVDSWLADPALCGDDGKLKKIPYDETSDYVEKVYEAMTSYRRLYYNN